MARNHRYKTFPKREKYSGLEKSATHVRYAGTEKNCRMTQHKSLKKWQNVQKQRFQKNNENDLKRNVRKRLTECPETKVPKNTSRLTGNEGPKKRMAERLETKVQKSKAAWQEKEIIKNREQIDRKHTSGMTRNKGPKKNDQNDQKQRPIKRRAEWPKRWSKKIQAEWRETKFPKTTGKHVSIAYHKKLPANKT
jgi:hypothetical protein